MVSQRVIFRPPKRYKTGEKTPKSQIDPILPPYLFVPICSDFPVFFRFVPICAPSFPCFFFEFLVFSRARNSLFFLSIFPFFSKDCRGLAGIKNPCSFGGFPGHFPKKQGKEGQGFARLVFGICSDLLRFLPICSDLFSEQIRTNQGNPFLPTPFANPWNN